MRLPASLIALALLTLLAAGPAAGAPRPPVPIPGPLSGPLPKYEGSPARRRPLDERLPEANSVLARNGRSGTGLAAGNGGFSPMPGPLGRGTTSMSALQFGACASLAFGSSGQLVGVCSGPTGPALRLVDPDTLATLAGMRLPVRPSANRTDRGGGTHFVMRADGTVLIPEFDQSVHTIVVNGSSLQDTGRTRLGGLMARGEQPFAVGAGFDGLDWAVGNRGTVMTLPRFDGSPRALKLHERVAEDIATDPSGTYVVTRNSLYRLRAGAGDQPKVVWRRRLAVGPADSHAGRVHPGPGTPPVIVDGRFVAVADGLNPPHLRVYDIESGSLHCDQRVFAEDGGSVEAPLVAAGRGLVVSNAYGYDSLLTTELGGTTAGGVERVNVGRKGCRAAWSSDLITPSVQPVVSRATGLLYTVAKPDSFPDAWNLAAIDWRSGRLRFQVLAGEGLGYNSDGGALVLGPDGAAYAGSFGGVTRFADTPAKR